MSVGGEKKLSRESHLIFCKELEEAWKNPINSEVFDYESRGRGKVMSAWWLCCCNAGSLESSAMPYQGMKTKQDATSYLTLPWATQIKLGKTF